MSETKPTPFVSDERIRKSAGSVANARCAPGSEMHAECASAWILGAETMRTIYESNLAEVRREMDELREEVAAMMSREAHVIQAANHEALERGYAQGYADGISVTKHNP